MDEPANPMELPEKPGGASRSMWLTLFSFSLAGILLYLTLRNLDWQAFWDALWTGNYAIIFITIPIACGNYLVRSLRWRVFLGSERRTSVASVFWANMIGYLGNSYLPARAGEVLRSAFLGQKTGLGTGFVLATALVERILDAIFLVLVGSAAILLQPGIAPELAAALRLMSIGAVAGLAFILVTPFQEGRILRVFNFLPLGESLKQKFSGAIGRFLLGMRSLHSPRRLTSFLLLTAAIWLVDAIGNTIGVRIVSQQLTLAQAFVLLAALGLSSAIPSTPGYVGVYQFVALMVLVPFGFSRAEALAYILISQISNYLLVTALGLIGLWQIRKNGNERVGKIHA
jgi:uncharacterized protein (TIRG00374 family)